jgi:hypothetical protein
MLRNLFLRLTLFFLASFMFGERGEASGLGQANNTLVLEVEDARPMAEAVIALGEQLQCPITYEDPPFESPDDLRPVFPGSMMYVPIGGRISFSYQKSPNAFLIVSQLLAEHRAAGNAGEFTVLQNNDIYNVIPVRYKNKAGKIVDHQSILDTRISISLQDTNCQRAIEAICTAVSKANTRFQLLLGLTPLNTFIGAPYSREVIDEPARDVINEILALHNASLKARGARTLSTWQVRFSPPLSEAEKPFYGLNFRRISLQSADSMKMRVLSERPMATAIQILEDRFGILVTYEDPPYVSADDLWQVEGTVKGLVGGIIYMDWDKTYSVEEVLQSLVQIRIGPRDMPAVFAMEEAGPNKYHIFPVVGKNEQGTLVSRTALLGHQISLNRQDIDGLSAIKSICSALSDLTNQNVQLGAVADSLSEILKKYRRPSISITNRKARDCLAELLWQINPAISWQLLYDPNSKGYHLNLTEVCCTIEPNSSVILCY